MRTAYGRTVQLANTLLAPLVIIKLIVDLQGSLDFLTEHIFASLVILLVLVVIFVIYLIDIRDLKESFLDATLQFRWRYFRVLVYVLSASALLAMLAVGIASTTSGIHFVIIASAPNRIAADREVEQINAVLEEKHLPDLLAQAYASRGDNPWYGIVIGGPHFSRDAAKEFPVNKAQRIDDAGLPGLSK